MAMEEAAVEGFLQNVVVMRHGDRIDCAEPMWAVRADRPWDPPLVEAGLVRARAAGKRLRVGTLGFPVHRVLVSPFLRCLQTAAEVVPALCADDDGDGEESGRGDAAIDPSRVKVSIEYGLCEVLGSETIHPDLTPVDGKWFPNISELETLLPAGTIDHSVECLYHRLPQWEESIQDARKRYAEVILALADKFPHENLLLITHGECVGVSVSTFLEGMLVYGVDYCAFSHLQRWISTSTLKAESFKVLTNDGQNGISYAPL